MPGRNNYEERRKYPHLIGEDTEVWTRFIRKYPERFDTVDYDVKVGKGTAADSLMDKTSRAQWTQLTQKRIDVIGYKNHFVTIIEIKKRVTLFTLGQILGYKYLYLREHPDLSVVYTLIVCSSIDQDDIDILNHYRIKFVIV